MAPGWRPGHGGCDVAEPSGPAIVAHVDTTVHPTPVQIDITFTDPTVVAGWRLTRNGGSAVPLLWTSVGALSAISLVDYSAPFGVPVSYTLTVTRPNLTTFAITSNVVTVTESGCWLTSGVDGASVPVTLVSWPTRQREPRTAILDVLNREDPVALMDAHRTPAGTMTFYTVTDIESDQLAGILAARGPIMFRSGPGRSIKSVTVVVGRIAENRFSKSGLDQRRMHVIDVQEVKPVPVALPLGATLGGLHSLLPGTLADIANYRPTLLALSQVRTA
jgi:hypothetical protein